MQTIYEKDLLHSIHSVALHALVRYEREHLTEFESLDLIRLCDIRNRLLRRAFEPKICVKMIKRLRDRGHAIVQGEGPVRPSIERRLQRFKTSLGSIIAEASDRLEAACL